MCGHTCGLQDNEGEKLDLGRRESYAICNAGCCHMMSCRCSYLS